MAKSGIHYLFWNLRIKLYGKYNFLIGRYNRIYNKKQINQVLLFEIRQAKIKPSSYDQSSINNQDFFIKDKDDRYTLRDDEINNLFDNMHVVKIIDSYQYQSVNF